ncbi:MAG: glutamyl-tRNA reductase [Candidatus Omnitrophica bacterium]|nr:glutamyl-tRNA reductase [Candidatus Omnitrophota bacterium]
MNFVVIGTSYRYSPIEIREKLFFSKRRLKEIMACAKETARLNSCIILSTCNRVEIYANVSHEESGSMVLREFLGAFHEISVVGIEPYLYDYAGQMALAHLLKVVSGLDSQILGESQISEQVKFAYSEAQHAGCVDLVLDFLFQQALRWGEIVRAAAGISAGSVSVGSIAVQLMKKTFGNLREKKILILGAGKVTELLVQSLKQEFPKTVFISNRAFEKAAQFADQLGGEAVRFDRFHKKLQDADIVVSSTSSTHRILHKEDFEKIDHSVCVIDLALPRNVDPEVGHISGIRLFNLDDFTSELIEDFQSKAKVVKLAEEFLSEAARKIWQEFLMWAPEPALWH